MPELEQVNTNRSMSSVPMSQLEPSPVDKSPSIEDENGVNPEDLDPEKAPSYFPPSSSPTRKSANSSIPHILLNLQKYSTIPPSIYLIMHYTNTAIIPLTTLSLQKAENSLLLTRPYYQSFPLEQLLIFAPIVTHALSGVSLRLYRRFQAAKRYGAETHAERVKITKALWPKLSLTSALGYALYPMMVAHVFVNRITPLKVHGDSSGVGLRFFSHGLRKHPLIAGVGYAFMVTVASFHFVGGAAKYLRLTREFVTEGGEDGRRKRAWRDRVVRGVSAVLAGVWALGGIGVVGRGVGAAPGGAWEIKAWEEVYKSVPVFGEWIRLYALGSNGSGQLGVSHKNDVWAPESCHFLVADAVQLSSTTHTWTSSTDEGIIKIAAGGNHTLLLTSKGRVFAAGSNDAGKCHLAEDLRESLVFRECLSDIWDDGAGAIVSDIAATWEASFFVLGGKEVFACGNGARGELGLGQDGVTTSGTGTMKCFDIRDFDTDATIVKIVACMSHLVVLDSKGKLYGWGSCRKGELGDSLRPMKIAWTPQRLGDVTFHVEQVVLGKDFTFILGVNGEEALLGENKHFRTTLLDPSDKTAGTSGPQVFAGWSSITALHSDGRVTGHGRDHKRQLSRLDDKRVKMLAVGSEHCVALCTEDEVLTWGWGEHGNCGEPVDERGCVACAFNVVREAPKDVGPHAEQIMLLGAGCATTFWGTSPGHEGHA